MLVWYHIDTWLIVSLSFSSCHGVVSCYMIAIIHDLQSLLCLLDTIWGNLVNH